MTAAIGTGANERLDTPRLVLRRPNAGDWPAARDFFMSDRSVGVGGPYELGRSWTVFAAEIGHWEIFGYGMWAVTLRGEETAIGLIGPWSPASWPETEIGWTIWSPEMEGTGIATEAARAAIAHAWNVLGWETIVSYISPDNSRSIRLAEKLGASLDEGATPPPLNKPTLVYRHPRPEGAQ